MAELTRLPGPALDAWDWQFEGACQGMDSSLFFHPDGERGMSRRRRIAGAKAICSTCPVMMECREHSIQAREPYGVWGGLSEDERALLISQRQRRSA
ncbi:WhiB family transcriptional regulator [Buchananella felis]|uniref:WhiB family transcriptional regulator n=1 Tax=Buchananella felis TaxID=3231492 RepID=UPI0035276B9A